MRKVMRWLLSLTVLMTIGLLGLGSSVETAKANLAFVDLNKGYIHVCVSH